MGLPRSEIRTPLGKEKRYFCCEEMIQGANKWIQRRGITGYAYGIAKKMMPKISDTERAALNAGTVGFDRNIFQGNPSLKDLEGYSVKHSAEEQGLYYHYYYHY